MRYFDYGPIETDYLSKQDEQLGSIILSFGKLNRKINPDIFQSLVHSVIAQQISSKAAATVYSRLESCLQKITPVNVFEAPENILQQCGMTHKKVSYMKAISAAIVEKSLNLSQLRKMDDEQVIQRLTKLPGIGRWTAEMILLHALERPNVFSYDDLIIRRSLMQLHDLSHLNREQFQFFRDRYTPYGSVAMIYLWQFSK